MSFLAQDVRFALRTLAKSPGFSLVAVLALALGIGANTAVFSVIDAVLLRPLPYGDSDALVRVTQILPSQRGSGGAAGPGGGPTSPANFVDWQNQNHVFADMAAFSTVAFNVTGQDEPERVLGARVTPNLFDVLKVKPLAGRTFVVDDGRPEAEPVAVVSQGFSKSHFGGDRQAVGRLLRLDGTVYHLVGVTVPGFTFGRDAQVWVPLVFSPSDLANRGTLSLGAIARLKPGATVERAKQDLGRVSRAIQELAPGMGDPWEVSVVTLKEQAVGNFRKTLLILLGAVGCVLLVACANVANLLLARAAERGREIAVRTALGASRGRLIRQMLTESVVLGLLGGLLGLLLAYWSIGLIIRFNPGNIPRLDGLGLDARILAFTLAISVATGLVFGLLPALQVSSSDVFRPLKEGGSQASAERHRYHVRNLLVISEVALALVLLIGAGLMVRSFQSLLAVDPGFNPADVLTLRMSLPQRKYPDPHQRQAFFQEVLARVRALPEVRLAGLVTTLPLEGGELREMILIAGRPMPPGEPPNGGLDVVTPDYFRTMGITVLKGRGFTERDREDAPPVVILDEAMARRYWPDEDPLGKRLMIPGVKPVYREIVGVVRGLKFYGLDSDRRPTLYVPLLQFGGERSMAIAVKTQSDPLRMAATLRRTVWEVDRDQTTSAPLTMEQLLTRSVAQRRFNTGMIEMFAALALILAVVGIHGVLSYSVARRTQEIGIRMALGAEGRLVLRSILGQAMGMVGSGVALGIAAAFALTRLLGSLLYGVSALDLLTYAGMSLLLSAVAMLASYLPARRATRVDPLVALRYE
ncbi:MAG TPA: ABC transporter permease [Thermoanaerobaculia bacterium]|nr:ABC transporter permease [Thermoanaerobaculia bacterium]